MLEKILIAMVAGLFGVLPAIFQWYSGRNKAKTYEHTILKLSNELEFLDKVKKFDSNDPLLVSDVEDEVKSIYQQYKSLQENKAVEKIKDTKIFILRRAFLLFKPFSFKGWFIHTTFYVIMIFALSMLLSEYQDPVIKPETGESRFESVLFGSVFIFGPILLLLQRIAIKIRNYDIKNG